MTIEVGAKLPEATFRVMTEDGPKEVSTADYFGGRKIVLFGVPGAFTPTCSNNHLPGFLENHDAILARGVDRIAVVSLNDVHVMGAWARFTGGEGKIDYLADGNGEFARATGLAADMSAPASCAFP
jgi:glutaredoxin/glutathione-dependent peroxiredoxin